jgi:hypothetical protein
MNFSIGKSFLFVLHVNKMIQDDAKSIGPWRFSYKVVPYHDDTIILMFFKMTNMCKQGDHQIPGAKELRCNQFSKWYGDRRSNEPT